jgi:hypothetical protein
MDTTPHARSGASDRVIFPIVTLALVILVWGWPVKTFEWLFMDQAPLFAAGIVLAAHLRNRDVILWFPTFPLTRIMSGTLLFRSLVSEIRIREIPQWAWLFEWRAELPTNTYRAAD